MNSVNGARGGAAGRLMQMNRPSIKNKFETIQQVYKSSSINAGMPAKEPTATQYATMMHTTNS